MTSQNRLKFFSILLVLVGSNAAAAPKASLHYSDQAVENRLSAWLGRQSFAGSPKKAVPPPAEMFDLKDALASPPDGLRADIVKAEGGRRRLLAERLPGMSPEPFNFCRVLEDCHKARISFHVDEEALVSDAAAALVRPWIILEKARASALDFAPVQGAGDRIMDLKLKSLPQAGLSLHVSAVATGGYDVWLTGLNDPAELFRRERASILP